MKNTKRTTTLNGYDPRDKFPRQGLQMKNTKCTTTLNGTTYLTTTKGT
jgi:hypothetical protein